MKFILMTLFHFLIFLNSTISYAVCSPPHCISTITETSKTFQKFILFRSNMPSFEDQTYWSKQILIFAKQVYRKNDFDFLKNNLSLYSRQSTPASFRLERFGEGFMERLEVRKSKKTVVIEIQQRAD